jgi:serine/threonine-protein kinase
MAPGESLVRRYDFGDVGYLLLLAEPWAEVEVDGRAVGQTPLSRIPVPAGVHEVRFRNPELGTREERVRVESGATVRTRADWRQP